MVLHHLHRTLKIKKYVLIVNFIKNSVFTINKLSAMLIIIKTRIIQKLRQFVRYTQTTQSSGRFPFIHTSAKVAIYLFLKNRSGFYRFVSSIYLGIFTVVSETPVKNMTKK